VYKIESGHITWIQSIYTTHFIHMYVVIYFHILMGRLHLVHHCKHIHLTIHTINFEHQKGCNSFGHICS